VGNITPKSDDMAAGHNTASSTTLVKDNDALLLQITEKLSKLDKLEELEDINNSLRGIRN